MHISDLHLAPGQAQKIRWVQKLTELHPDLIVLTGDQLGHPGAIPHLLAALGPVLESAPSVFVHGSNDYYGPRLKNPLRYLKAPSRLGTRVPNINTPLLTAELEARGAISLNNSATRLTINGTLLELFGMNDPHIRLDDAEKMRSKLAEIRGEKAEKPAANKPGATTKTTAATSGEPATRIGVVHAPYQEALNELLRAGADVIFAGHTHGGQVRIPGIGALTSNCDLPPKQARGLSAWFDAHHTAYLNVSAGMGTSIYAPVRFACRPEVTLLTLEAAS